LTAGGRATGGRPEVACFAGCTCLAAEVDGAACDAKAEEEAAGPPDDEVLGNTDETETEAREERAAGPAAADVHWSSMWPRRQQFTQNS
jgi:hypothetical protein